MAFEKLRKKVSLRSEHKDPDGGLTQKGRDFYNQKTGSNLKPGVKGAADSPEKKRRKGSFLTRFYCKEQPPLEKDGKPTRHALAAREWGESAPSSQDAVASLCSKGRNLLKRYKASKEK